MARITYTEGSGGRWRFFCPGCKVPHDVYAVSAKWQVDGGEDDPTIRHPMRFPTTGCHCVIEKGRIKFYDTCTHELRGQTVDLPHLVESEVTT